MKFQITNKINYLFILLLSLSIGLSSCGDEWLEVVPDGTTTLDQFLQSPEDVQEALNSAYSALRSGSFMGGQTWLLSELMADHLAEDAVSLNGDWFAHYTWTTDIFLGTTRSFMHDGYKVIGRANFVLDNIENVTGLPEDVKSRVIAECKFLRGMSHFELVRIFAQPYGYTPDNSHLALPIRLSYDRDVLPRATMADYYAQIILDLTDAANALPENNGGYATKWAAMGYLAKVYFQMNDFENAREYSKEVIEMGPFSFDPDLSARFSLTGSPENVFELISTGFDDNSGGALRDHYFPNPGNSGVPSVYMSSYIGNLATLDTADRRGKLWLEEVSEGVFYNTKYTYSDAQQVPLVHLTELKLIRAESLAELGLDIATALMDINDIRERANIPPVAGDFNDVITFARQQRELEMMSEGNRLHELKREAVRGNAALLIRGVPWDCPGMVAQLPDNELSGNPGMVPNDEGGCN